MRLPHPSPAWTDPSQPPNERSSEMLIWPSQSLQFNWEMRGRQPCFHSPGPGRKRRKPVGFGQKDLPEIQPFKDPAWVKIASLITSIPEGHDTPNILQRKKRLKRSNTFSKAVESILAY